MSVVTVVTCNDFSLIMGDTKLSNDSHGDKVTKIFKNENMLLGFTGNIIEVGTYLYPIFDCNMNINNDFLWEDPVHFFFFLDYKFYKMLNEGNEKDIIFVASAKIGEKYITKYYCLSNSSGHKWSMDTIISDDMMRYFYLGDHVHKDYFHKKLSQNPVASVENIINIFQDTINYGVQFDNTINNEMEYKYI